MFTVIERLWKLPIVQKHVTVPTTEGFIIEGECFHVAPFNQRTYVEIDAPQGAIGGPFIGFLSQLGKWGFHREKIEEWIEVSPAHPQYYQSTIQQKQQLETQIKSGLASIASAVSDFELIFHDVRKYKEFMSYFEKIERGKKEKKPELIEEGEQTLKAIFIDLVDVHTGEGIALKLIAPRWPTVIADFMKLKDEDVDPKKIAEKLKVSEAEGVVLATKNKLYNEWRKEFKKTVIDRYGRLMAMMKARRRSIEEYMNMLKPYMARYKYIRELGETPAGRRALEAVSWLRPAGKFVATSVEFSTIWAWRAFAPPEVFKPPREAETRPPGSPEPTKNIFKLKIAKEFKEWIKREYGKIKDEIKKRELNKISPTGIEPLDKWVWRLFPAIQEAYKIKFTILDILDARDTLIKQYNQYSWNWVKSPYFMTLELPVLRTTLLVQGGGEVNALVFYPGNRNYMDTQNIILLRILELKAKEKQLENFIAEMLGEAAGTAPGSQMLKDIIKGEFPLVVGEGEKRPEKKKEKKVSMESIVDFIRSKLGLNLRFIKPGPYETTFDDRISGPYMREIAQYLYKPMMAYWKKQYGVPGFV